jgi:hypothetical protein
MADNPKVMALAEAWGVSEAEAGWAIIRLWTWTMRYAARGRLAPGARPALERACNVRPTALGVVDGLVSAGWLDDLGPDGWQVHDWEEHNGAAVAKAEKDAERKREARKRRGDGAETARAARADGAGTGRDGTGRDETLKEGREPDGPPPPLELLPEVTKAKRTPKPPDPEAEFERFKAALTSDEREVFRAFGEAFAVDLGPDWGLKKFVGQKLKAHHAAELVAAIRGAAKDPWYRNKPTTLRALLSDASKVATLAKLGAA